MKKLAVIMGVLLVLPLMLTACSVESPLAEEPETTAVPETNAPTEAAEDPGDVGQPPHFILNFVSYEDLFKAFTYEGSSSNGIMVQALTNGDQQPFCDLVESVRSGSRDIFVPVIDGAPVELQKERDEPITLFTREKFALPWIWYHSVCGGKGFVVEICDLVPVLPDVAASGESYAEVSKMLMPQYPTADTDPEEYAASFTSVNEEQIVLSGGKTVTATVFKYRDSIFPGRICYRFLIDGILVCVWNVKDELPFDSAFWAGFGIMEGKALF